TVTSASSPRSSSPARPWQTYWGTGRSTRPALPESSSIWPTRCTMPTASGSSTATSSRPTSCSKRTVGRCSWTSGWRGWHGRRRSSVATRAHQLRLEYAAEPDSYESDAHGDRRAAQGASVHLRSTRYLHRRAVEERPLSAVAQGQVLLPPPLHDRGQSS